MKFATLSQEIGHRTMNIREYNTQRLLDEKVNKFITIMENLTMILTQ